jgi:hypothetical protein
LNCWPNGLSIGHASWQAEQGMPYFLAKAGMAIADWQSTKITTRRIKG